MLYSIVFFFGCVNFNASTTHYNLVIANCSNGTRTVTVTRKDDDNPRSLVFVGQPLSAMDNAGNVAEGFGARFVSPAFPPSLTVYSNEGYKMAHGMVGCPINAGYIVTYVYQGREKYSDAGEFPMVNGVLGITWDTLNKSSYMRGKELWDDELEGRWNTLFDEGLWRKIEKFTEPLASR